MGGSDDANAVRLGERASLKDTIDICDKERKCDGTDLTSGNPRPCLCTPTCHQEAQGMTRTEQDTSEERPLLTSQPLIIPDVVRIG